MTPARILLGTIVGCVALTMSCSDSGSDNAGEPDEPATTGADPSATNAGAADGSQPEDTYEGMNSAIRAAIADNEGDLCGVFSKVSVIQESVDPTSDQEAELAADALVSLLDALADESADLYPEASTKFGDAAIGIREVVDASDDKVETVANLSETAADELELSSEATYEISELCGPPSG